MRLHAHRVVAQQHDVIQCDLGEVDAKGEGHAQPLRNVTDRVGRDEAARDRVEVSVLVERVELLLLDSRLHDLHERRHVGLDVRRARRNGRREAGHGRQVFRHGRRRACRRRVAVASGLLLRVAGGRARRRRIPRSSTWRDARRRAGRRGVPSWRGVASGWRGVPRLGLVGLCGSWVSVAVVLVPAYLVLTRDPLSVESERERVRE